jgi:chondroitin-sulfate-ABC endolyase/exolyase
MARKMRKLISSSVFCLGFILISNMLSAQVLDICENKVPKEWKAISGNLSIDGAHFKEGNESILWKWTKSNSTLIITDTAFASVASAPRSSFVFWIYNEKPIAGNMLFEFDKDGRKASSFTFNLNFKGWRTAWVMYHRDMNGKPVAGMNRLIIHAPNSVKMGALYFDGMLYNTSINPRSPMRDEQVPFVNISSDHAANAHWTALYSFRRNQNYLPLSVSITPQQSNDLDTIQKRYQDILLSDAGFQKAKLSGIEKAFNFWNIKRTKNGVSGKPVYGVNDAELFPASVSPSLIADFKKSTVAPYSELMLKVAGVYSISKDAHQKEILSGIFLDLLDHLDDQGWAAGSGMGALHHLGYTFRDFYSACLLMKPVLKAHKKFDRTWKTMYWFSGLGRTQPEIGKLADFNVDVFNTLLGSMFSTVLMMDNSPAKVRQMNEFSNWLSQAVMPTYSIDGTFKPDGAVFHHGNLYPAYGVGGFQGITPVVYSLSRTTFGIKPAAQASLKKVLITMHYYTNPVYWPMSLSGRHPTGPWKIPDDPFAYMALAGTPDGTQKIDREMAGIYRDINKKPNDHWVREFDKDEIEPSTWPHGHWNVNYGLLDIHRRSDWLVTVRGHNRYFIANESYPGANMYGRYIAYGQLEVTYPQTEKERGSSFQDKGWDWNNLPGTTTLHVPLNKLRANVLNVDDFSGVEEMLISDEKFAGGTNFNQSQGLFAMKLHGHDKYDMGSFRANKSWFMFDSLVICLGSNITNSIKDYPTQTTLFQNSLDDKNASFFVNGEKDTSWPYEHQWSNTQDLTIMDNRKIGYFIPAQKNLVFTRKEQTSRDQTDKEETRGDVAMLVLDHGNAPHDQSYQYAMLIETNPADVEKFKINMQSTDPVYKVLRQDSIAHTVWYAPQNITASALFKINKNSNDSLIISNSRPCLLMYQKKDDTLNLTVTDPDLAFYSGPDDSPLTPDGKRKEVSIYSRSWYRTPSHPSVVELIIKGRWTARTTESKVRTVVMAGGNTRLSIPCEYGIASELKLKKIKD